MARGSHFTNNRWLQTTLEPGACIPYYVSGKIFKHLNLGHQLWLDVAGIAVCIFLSCSPHTVIRRITVAGSQKARSRGCRSHRNSPTTLDFFWKELKPAACYTSDLPTVILSNQGLTTVCSSFTQSSELNLKPYSECLLCPLHRAFSRMPDTCILLPNTL